MVTRRPNPHSLYSLGKWQKQWFLGNSNMALGTELPEAAHMPHISVTQNVYASDSEIKLWLA